MEREDDFDAFYRDTRHRLLHQAFALTGDLQAATAAVRDAYVAAWHHWRKVAPLEDRLSWVRPLAWQLAQRRHAGRLWHRNRGLSDEHRATLAALGRLTPSQRRTLLLVQLAGLPLPAAARELAVTQEVAESHLQHATAAVSMHLDADPARLRSALLELDTVVADAGLPRPSIVRRAGRKRRQVHTLAAVVVAAVVGVGSGAVAYQPPADQPRPGTPPGLTEVLPQQPEPAAERPALPSAEDLLDQDQIRRLGRAQEWRVVATHPNTRGDGINTVCQRERFADPDGLAALVRVFEAKGKADRRAVQTVEVSESVRQARRAYRTVLGWYAGCQEGRLQLVRAYRVDRLGAEADVLLLRLWKRPVSTVTVALARTGSVVTSTVGRSAGANPPPTGEVVQSLADAVAMLCGRDGATDGATDCANTPRARPVPPPPAGAARGALGAVDLPPVGRVRDPWVGTKVPARPDPSVTTCDRADLVRAGARRTGAWTYLIPEARLPARFGLSETYGVFGRPEAARRFLAQARASFAGCEDRDLATDVTSSASGRVARSGADWSTWTFVTEVNERLSVRFRVGLVRVGPAVAHLTFVAAPGHDLRADHFRALVVRAGDRLRELR